MEGKEEEKASCADRHHLGTACDAREILLGSTEGNAGGWHILTFPSPSSSAVIAPSLVEGHAHAWDAIGFATFAQNGTSLSECITGDLACCATSVEVGATENDPWKAIDQRSDLQAKISEQASIISVLRLQLQTAHAREARHLNRVCLCGCKTGSVMRSQSMNDAPACVESPRSHASFRSPSSSASRLNTPEHIGTEASREQAGSQYEDFGSIFGDILEPMRKACETKTSLNFYQMPETNFALSFWSKVQGCPEDAEATTGVEAAAIVPQITEHAMMGNVINTLVQEVGLLEETLASLWRAIELILEMDRNKAGAQEKLMRLLEAERSTNAEHASKQEELKQLLEAERSTNAVHAKALMAMREPLGAGVDQVKVEDNNGSSVTRGRPVLLLSRAARSGDQGSVCSASQMPACVRAEGGAVMHARTDGDELADKVECAAKREGVEVAEETTRIEITELSRPLSLWNETGGGSGQGDCSDDAIGGVSAKARPSSLTRMHVVAFCMLSVCVLWFVRSPSVDTCQRLGHGSDQRPSLLSLLVGQAPRSAHNV